jgi:hypothetical protein
MHKQEEALAVELELMGKQEEAQHDDLLQEAQHDVLYYVQKMQEAQRSLQEAQRKYEQTSNLKYLAHWSSSDSSQRSPRGLGVKPRSCCSQDSLSGRQTTPAASPRGAMLLSPRIALSPRIQNPISPRSQRGPPRGELSEPLLQGSVHQPPGTQSLLLSIPERLREFQDALHVCGVCLEDKNKIRLYLKKMTRRRRI